MSDSKKTNNNETDNNNTYWRRSSSRSCSLVGALLAWFLKTESSNSYHKRTVQTFSHRKLIHDMTCEICFEDNDVVMLPCEQTSDKVCIL